MTPYSMDLRLRVLRDSDAGMGADAVAERYHVSASWVRRLKQRRRELGEVAPRHQSKWRTPILMPDLQQLEALVSERPDWTLDQLRQALGTSASVTTVWRAVEHLAAADNRRRSRPRARSRPRREAV